MDQNVRVVSFNNKNDKSKIKCFKYGKLETHSSTGLVLGVLPNGH